MTSDTQIKTNMDRMYRITRHVYDASRKYYLLGRDRLIDALQPDDGAHICEVGCGTARNLVKLAQRYPKAHFYGLDVSDEMLKTARKNLLRKKLSDVVKLQQGFAQNFFPEKIFGLKQNFSTIIFSYALSIIPPWKESIDHALTLLPSGGEIHIVDFGAMEAQPKWFRDFIFWWLSIFHVYHKPEILTHLQTLETNGQGSLAVESIYNGYAYLAIFKKA